MRPLPRICRTPYPGVGPDSPKVRELLEQHERDAELWGWGQPYSIVIERLDSHTWQVVSTWPGVVGDGKRPDLLLKKDTEA